MKQKAAAPQPQVVVPLQPLPIDEHLHAIVEMLRKHRSLVLVAEPGAGKTTRVPPAVVRSGLLSSDHPNVVMLQPRRVAARASAMRIGQEQSWGIGREVGYHVRFEKRISHETRLRVLTEGILTRQLLEDPTLEGVGCVILDEFHERSIHSDLCIAMLREIRETIRPDLLLVVMSATIDAAPIAAFLGNAGVMNVAGRLFPIDIAHESNDGRPLESRASAAVLRSLESPGDVLVFLPGVREIDDCIGALSGQVATADALILALHGSMEFAEQNRVLERSTQRRIICATNIAETSLTIDGVRTVIDSGLARVASFDAQRGLDRLDLKQISKASATQRAGRAGRTAPGRCVRLYSAKEFHAMSPFELPEMRRVDLCQTILALHTWSATRAADFGWFEAPDVHRIESAERLLEMLGAMESGKITALGKRMMSLPLHPRLARLMLAAEQWGCAAEGAMIAAMLSEKDVLRVDRFDRSTKSKGPSDLLIRMDLIERGSHDSLDFEALRQVRRVREELLRIVDTPRAKQSPADEELLLKMPLLAYPDRVARRRESDPSAGTIVGGGGVRLAPESVVRDGEFFLALDAREDARSRSREAVVRIASRVERAWLEELFRHRISRTRELEFDETRQRVVARGVTRFEDLMIREDRDAPVDADLAGAVLADALRGRARAIFESDEPSAHLLRRIEFARQHLPEREWPAVDDAAIGEYLALICAGRRGVDELRSIGLSVAISSQLRYPLDRVLDEHVPQKMEVPSGSRIVIEYARNAKPSLAVRLQEIFGMQDTPRIAAGRVPLVLHLLGPNYRPVQVTEDLRSFWAGTYAQVRKDLRARYPRHSWPDDPLTAPPQAKGGVRR